MSMWKPKRWLAWIVRAVCRKVPSEQRHSKKQASQKYRFQVVPKWMMTKAH
jgi:hypothetical protein